MHQPLSGFDRFFLALDSPATPMHIGAIVVLRANDKNRHGLVNRIVTRLRRRLSTVPRLCGYPARGNRWIRLPHFDPVQQIYRHTLAAPGDDRTLIREAADLYSAPLPKHKPLWRVHLIQGLSGNRIALLCTLHHSLFDGVAATSLLTFLSDGAETPQMVAATPHDRGTSRSNATLTAVNLARRWLTESAPMAPLTPFNASIDRRRCFGVTSLPVNELRSLASRHKTSINAVFLSECSGALRHYLGLCQALPKQSLIALMPISVRDDSSAAGNRLSVVFCPLATNIENAADRLQAINRRNMHLLRSQAGDERQSMGEVIEWLSPTFGLISLQARFFAPFASMLPPLCNLAVSHLEGPDRALKIAGARVLHAYPLSMIWHNVGLSITGLSIGERYDVTFTGNPRIVPRIDELASALDNAHRELRDAR